jgi:hypothetical protein
VNLDEIMCGGDDTEDDLDSLILNAVALIIPKWWKFKHLRWVKLLNRMVYLDEFFYGGDGIEYYLL